MKAEDIIEGLNKHIEDQRSVKHILTKGHLVLQRIITTNPTFKAYKTYEAIIWFVKGKERYKVLELKHTAKVLDGQEEKIERDVNIELCHYIFNWVDSDYYNQVIEGEYKGYVSEDRNE